MRKLEKHKKKKKTCLFNIISIKIITRLAAINTSSFSIEPEPTLDSATITGPQLGGFDGLEVYVFGKAHKPISQSGG